MDSKHLLEQRVDNLSSNDDLKKSINSLPTSSPQNPAPNPFVARRKTSQGGANGTQSSSNSKDSAKRPGQE
jgi:hypothetical protein